MKSLVFFLFLPLNFVFAQGVTTLKTNTNNSQATTNLIELPENSVTSHQLTDNRLSMSEAEKRVLRAKIEYDEAVKEFEKIKTTTEAQITSLRAEKSIPKECILSPKGLGVYYWILVKDGKPESCVGSTPTTPTTPVPSERGK